jgi:hypothetical protein
LGRQRTTSKRRRHDENAAARAALTVVVVGGTALAALTLHPGSGLTAKGRGPLGGNPLLVIGLALAALLGGLALRGAYREQVGTDRELGPVEQRLADAVSRFLLAAPFAVALLVLALHRFDAGGGTPRPEPTPRFPDGDRTPPLLPTPPPPRHHRPHDGHGLPVPLIWILVGLAIALAVVAVVAAGVLLWRYLVRPGETVSGAQYAVLDGEEERLAQAVDSGRRALLDGDDARTAVIACYLAMQESLAGSGVARRASDTPQDLLERAVAGGLPAAASTAELTALFREARYSTHPMDGGHRDRATAALAAIADGLRARSAAAGARADAGKTGPEPGSEARPATGSETGSEPGSETGSETVAGPS